MTESLDVATLMAALKNENNETIMDLDHNKIQKIKDNMLEKLRLTKMNIPR